MSVPIYEWTRRHIPEDLHLYQHRFYGTLREAMENTEAFAYRPVPIARINS